MAYTVLAYVGMASIVMAYVVTSLRRPVPTTAKPLALAAGDEPTVEHEGAAAPEMGPGPAAPEIGLGAPEVDTDPTEPPAVVRSLLHQVRVCVSTCACMGICVSTRTRVDKYARTYMSFYVHVYEYM